MMQTVTMEAAGQDDAELVAESLAGNQDAFRHIVERYQTLICSLAYCATGNVGQSEELAQETFVTAWKDLAELREPLKLRSWLCAIVRFRISKQFRKQGREPVHLAEPLEAIEAVAAAEALPSAQTITKEETAILWRSLERLPEMYREPLVLFYREHHSIETVARHLDLSEDTVKQRLSRGRKMLQEQVLAFVEGALGETNPGQAFTLAVLAALPATNISVKAATFGAAAKGAAAAKGTGLLGLGGAILTPLIALSGMWADYRLKRNAGHPERELNLVKFYYIAIASSVAVFVLACTLLMASGGWLIQANPALFASLVVGLISGYFLVIAAFARRFVRAAKQPNPLVAPAEKAAIAPVWEYRSRFELLGLPLIHVRFGGALGGRMEDRLKRSMKPLKAWFAVTDTFAIGGFFAYGGWAIAPISVGAFSVGLLSCGALTVGALAVGGFGFGIWAIAPLAVGWQSFGGGCAIAWNAAWAGHYAVAHHFALGEVARATQANNEFVLDLLNANPFFRWCATNLNSNRLMLFTWVWLVPIVVSQIVQGCIAWRQRNLKQENTN